MVKRGIKQFFLIVFSILLVAGTFSQFTAAIRMSSDDYVVTSYWTVHEEFYSGEKVAVKDGEGELLGYYRQDFVADVKVEGWGKGDGAENDGEYLGYDPSIGFMKSDSPLDAYGRPLIPWKTVATDSSIPKGTKVTIKSLGSKADVEDWIAEKLLTTTFVVSDRGPSVKGHHIDVYVGDQTQRDMNESPLALYVSGATVYLGVTTSKSGVSPAQPSPAQYVPGEVIVGLKNAADHPLIIQLIEDKGGTVIRQLDDLDAVVAKVSEERVEAFMEEMRESSLVEYVERNGRVMLGLMPNDPGWSDQWGPKKIQADTAWNTQTGDKSILVAVVDTGVDWNHPDLAANYVALGYDWWNYDSDPMDDHGHGTHCAGIIAAVLNNGKGIAGLAQVRVMAEKFLGSDGWGTFADAASALRHAADAGADIISNSWGSYWDSDLVHEAVRYAYNKGALLVAAAGNDGSNSKLYPAAYDEVVAVTATDQYDNPAWFTNYGSWVEVAAPGVSIYSTVWDDSYASWSGTSMATPHVAGVAALIWSQFPDMTRDQVRARLRDKADDLGDPGFDVYYGYGRVNAKEAVGTSPPSAPSGLTATAVSSSQINLAWTDNSADERDFHIERKVGSGGTWNEINTVGANTVSYQDTGLRPSTTYHYRVRAHRHSDNVYSGYSNEASATTQTLYSGPHALRFNGDDYVEVDDSASLDVTSEITIEAWLHIDVADGTWRVAARKENAYVFGEFREGNKFVCWLMIGGTYIDVRTTVEPSTFAGAWHHFAFTYDGAKMRIYVDGSLVNSRDQTGAIDVSVDDLYIGSQGGTTEFFDGIIDEFRIYNRALSSKQIAYSYENGVPEDQNGLVMWLRMNEGGGSTAHDETDNGNDGAIHGPTWVKDSGKS